MLLGRLILEGNPHTADIVFCKPGMNTEKMSVETFAQPVPEFRHHHPMLDLLIIVFIKGPRIIPPPPDRGLYACPARIQTRCWVLKWPNKEDWF